MLIFRINYFLLPTEIWIVVTTTIVIWITRIYLNSFLALRKGKVKERKPSTAVLHGSEPLVSIILPTYNESRVIGRLLSAVTKIDYRNFEVIVADDSTDGKTMEVLGQWQEKGIRVIHRDSRKGFKAGALNNAMLHISPKSEYILIFDADYVPQKEIIWQMLGDFSSKEIAAVQGYTKHTLNASKNIWTKAVSIGFSAYSLVDIPIRKKLNGFIPLFGSVTMVSRQALSEVNGFSEDSITEDYELACKLEACGYSIMFDEGIAVPAECPDSFRVLLKQQMRWAEGITRDTKNHLRRLLSSKKLNLMKKFDYVYYGFSSLNGIIGTAAYSLTAFVFMVQHHLILHSLGVDSTFVTALGPYGNFLLNVAPGYVALGLISMVIVGLYREGRLRDVLWVAYFYLVTLLLAPFIAISGIRGLLLKKGSWSRTKKTGEVIREVHP